MVLKIGIIDGENTSQYTGSFSGSFSGSFHGSGITPNLDEVTTAGNTTTNDITVGGVDATAKAGISASWGIKQQVAFIDDKTVLSSKGYSPTSNYPTSSLVLGFDIDWENFIYGNESQNASIFSPPLSHTFYGNITSSNNITASGHLFASASQSTEPFGPGIQLAVYNTSSGEFMYTASSAVGGNTNTPTLDEVTTAGDTTNNSIKVNSLTSTGKGGISASWGVAAQNVAIENNVVLASNLYNTGTPVGTLKVGPAFHWKNFIYGNTNTLSHTFKGNITASSDISASGDMLTNTLRIDPPAGNTAAVRFRDFGGSSRHAMYVGGTSDPTSIQNALIIGNTNFNGVYFPTSVTASGNISASLTGSFGRLVVKNKTDIAGAPQNPINAQFEVAGNGYGTYIHMNSDASYIGHNSSIRDLIFQTNETNRIVIDGNGDKTTFNTNISASGEVIATRFKADGFPSEGYFINGTSSMHEKDNVLKIGNDNGKEWERVDIGDSSAAGQEIRLGSPHVTMPTIYSQGSVSTGTNVVTMGPDGRIYITGSYGGSSSGKGYVAQLTGGKNGLALTNVISQAASWAVPFTTGFGMILSEPTTGTMKFETNLGLDAVVNVGTPSSADLRLVSATAKASPLATHIVNFTSGPGITINRESSQVIAISSSAGNGFNEIADPENTSNTETTPFDKFYIGDNLSLTTTGTSPTANVQIDFEGYSGTTDNGVMTYVPASAAKGGPKEKAQSEPNLTFDGTTLFVGANGSAALRVGSTAPANTTNGKIVASNDIVAFATSDERLKKYIKPIPNALDKVSQIRGVEFDWKATDQKMRDEVHSFEGHDVGVIAQEIEKVLPEVVTTRDNGYKAVKYEKIVPLLIESIKELKAEIEELKKSK